MNRKLTLAIVGLATATASVAVAQQTKDNKPAVKPITPSKAVQPAGQPEMQLPPGMTMEDMQACMEAATPGPMHEHLVRGQGIWHGKNTMWMTPAAEPMVSECVSTLTPIMDGRFMKCETTGEMPGMGAFNGFAIYGFDNVSQKFQGTWVDNMGTGMMVGTGELSSDGKTLNWTYNYNCPITKKPVVFREVEQYTGDDTMTLTMYGPDPHTGKEFKVMEIKYTRVSKTATADAETTRVSN